MKDTFTSEPMTEQLRSLDGRAQVQTTAIEVVGGQVGELSRNQRGILQVLEQHQAMFGRIDGMLGRLASQNDASVKFSEETARTLLELRAQLGELRSVPGDVSAGRAEMALGFKDVERGVSGEISRTRELVGALPTTESVNAMISEGAVAQGLASTRAQIVNELQKVQQVLAMHGVDMCDRLGALPSVEQIRAAIDMGSVAQQLEPVRADMTLGLQKVQDALAQVPGLAKAELAGEMQGFHDVMARQLADMVARVSSVPSAEQIQAIVNNGTIATELASAWSQLVDGLQRVQEAVGAHSARIHEQLAALPSAEHVQGLVNGGVLVQDLAKARSEFSGGLQKISYEVSARIDGVQSRLAAMPTGDEFRTLIGSGAIMQELASVKAQLSDAALRLQNLVSEHASGVQAKLVHLPSTEQVHALIEGGTASSLQSTRKLVAEEGLRGQAVAERTATRLAFLQSRSVIPLSTQGLVMCRNPLGYVAVPADDLATIGALADGVLPKPGTLKFIEKHLRPGGTFVDVGANVGLFSLLAARVAGPNGRVIAIEPAPVTAHALRAMISANGLEAVVRVEEVAAGAERGLGTLSIMSNCRQSTLMSTAAGSVAQEGSVVTSVAPLDEILGNTVPDIVKISVEGWELKVLDGMQGLLAAHPEVIIVMEFDPAHIRSTGLSAAGWVDRMGAAGMRIFEIDDRNGELLPLRRSGIEEIVSTNVVITRNPALRREGADDPLWQTS